MTSVVLADEQTMLRDGLARAFASNGRFQVAGQCGDGKAALKLAKALNPDAIILDCGLQGLSALEVTRRLRHVPGAPKVILLGMRRDRQAVLDALHCGASGYVLKSDPTSCLLEALGVALSGSVYLSPQLEPARVFSPPKPSRRQRSYEHLTLRERQVFDMTVAGLRTKDIAEQLDLSPKTVSTYRLKLMAKLGIHDLPGLVRYAIRKGLISA